MSPPILASFMLSNLRRPILPECIWLSRALNHLYKFEKISHYG